MEFLEKHNNRGHCVCAQMCFHRDQLHYSASSLSSYCVHFALSGHWCSQCRGFWRIVQSLLWMTEFLCKQCSNVKKKKCNCIKSGKKSTDYISVSEAVWQLSVEVSEHNGLCASPNQNSSDSCFHLCSQRFPTTTWTEDSGGSAETHFHPPAMKSEGWKKGQDADSSLVTSHVLNFDEPEITTARLSGCSQPQQ